MKRIFLFLFLMVPSAYAAPYQSMSNGLSKSSYLLQTQFSMFSTSEVHTNFDQTRTLGDKEYFFERDLNLNFRYGLANRLEWGVGAKFRQVEGAYDTGTQVIKTSSMGFHSLNSDFKYTFSPMGSFEYATFVRLAKTFLAEPSLPEKANDLPLGDPGLSYEIGLAASFFLTPENILSFKTSLGDPGDFLSKEIAYQGELALLWPKLALVGGVSGIYSLETDGDTDNPANKINHGRNFTNRYYTLNRQTLNAFGEARIGFGQSWELGVRYQQTLNAHHYDLGQTYLIDLKYLSNKDNSQNINETYKNYRLEGEVVKISKAKKYVVIDKGLMHEVTRGMRFHIFKNDYTGGSQLIAIGVAVKVQTEKSIIKITKRYDQTLIEPGFVARGGQLE